MVEYIIRMDENPTKGEEARLAEPIKPGRKIELDCLYFLELEKKIREDRKDELCMSEEYKRSVLESIKAQETLTQFL